MSPSLTANARLSCPGPDRRMWLRKVPLDDRVSRTKKRPCASHQISACARLTTLLRNAMRMSCGPGGASDGRSLNRPIRNGTDGRISWMTGSKCSDRVVASRCGTSRRLRLPAASSVASGGRAVATLGDDGSAGLCARPSDRRSEKYDPPLASPGDDAVPGLAGSAGEGEASVPPNERPCGASRRVAVPERGRKRPDRPNRDPPGEDGSPGDKPGEVMADDSPAPPGTQRTRLERRQRSCQV